MSEKKSSVTQACALSSSSTRGSYGSDRQRNVHWVLALVSQCRPFVACSHRRHGQDKTVVSCPCQLCEHNWRQDKTVLSRLDPVSNLQLFSLKYIEDYWKKTTENLETGNWVYSTAVWWTASLGLITAAAAVTTALRARFAQTELLKAHCFLDARCDRVSRY